MSELIAPLSAFVGFFLTLYAVAYGIGWSVGVFRTMTGGTGTKDTNET
jgi:hypothetical protein